MNFFKGLVSENQLTAGQYRRANRSMAWSIFIIMLIFMLVELTSAECEGNILPKWLRFAAYIGSMVFSGMIVGKNATKKFPSIVMAVAFAIDYGLLIFSHHSSCMLLVFPALLTMVVFMNGKMIMGGSVATILLVLVKAFTLQKYNGDLSDFRMCNIMIAGIFICMICGCNSIRLSIDFNNEVKSRILKKSEEQGRVANTISDQVSSLDTDFHTVIDTVTEVGFVLSSAIDSMNSITSSTEKSTDAVDRQAGMTGEISNRLEDTSSKVENVMSVTETLMESVSKGKEQSDELEKQSVLVDENTTQISKIVDNLVNNVEQVSSITESILAISDQTNLLALNASIEAARAGESGKGFAVVADQIRSLAEETKNATEMITAIIEELNGVTTETQQGIEKSVESINQQRAMVQEVNDSFNNIEIGMNQMSEQMGDVVSQVTAVLDANGHIVESISTLTSATEEVANNADSGSEQMSSLGGKMDNLTSLITDAFGQLQVLRDVAVLSDDDEEE